MRLSFRLLFFTVVFVLCCGVVSAASYPGNNNWRLIANSTFTGEVIGALTCAPTANTWSIESSGCYQGSCLKLTGTTASYGNCYYNNQTWNVTGDFLLRFQIEANAVADGNSGGALLRRIKTYIFNAMGWTAETSNGNYYFNVTADGSSNRTSESTPFTPNLQGVWVFCELNNTNNRANIACFANVTNNTILGGSPRFFNLTNNDGFIGFFAGRTTWFDNFELWVPSLFSVTASNVSGPALINFSVIIEGVQYNTTTGQIATPYARNASKNANVTVLAPGFFNRTYVDFNFGSDLAAVLYYPGYALVTYSGNITHLGVNYTRELDYNISVFCNSTLTTVNVSRFINGVVDNSSLRNCTQNTSFVGEYQHSSEGIFTIFFTIKEGDAVGVTSTARFLSDLNNPSATVSYGQTVGVSNNDTIDYNLRCVDAIFPNLNYTLSLNGTILNQSNQTNGTNLTVISTIRAGAVLSGVCGDPFGNGSASSIVELFVSRFNLVNEFTLANFNLSQVTSAVAWFTNNSQSYDIKGSANTTFFVKGRPNDYFRVELTYPDVGQDYVTVTRYFSIALTQSNVSICANNQGVDHFLQFFTSGISRPVIVRNSFTQCYILADYTRFATQDFLAANAFTADTNYYVQSVSNGRDVFLGALDGPFETTTNIDNLIFVAQGYNINQGGQTLVSQSFTNSSIRFDFLNTGTPFVFGTFSIINEDTDVVVFSTSSFTDPNEFTVYFDFSLLGVNDTTLFRVNMNGTDADGEEESVELVVSLSGAGGFLPAGLVFILVVLFLLSGLTVAANSVTFGWFGIVMGIISLILTTLAEAAWYIRFLQAACALVTIYIGISWFMSGTE